MEPAFEFFVFDHKTEDAAGDMHLSPLFTALVCQLPRHGSKWTAADRMAWMKMFYAIADALHPESMEAEPVQQVTTREIKHEKTEKLTVTDTSREIPQFTPTARENKWIDGLNGAAKSPPSPEEIEELSAESTRRTIINVLKASERLLSAKEIWESDDSLDETQCASQLSHMTLRKGWLKREKQKDGRDGRKDIYVYQLADGVEIPESV